MEITEPNGLHEHTFGAALTPLPDNESDITLPEDTLLYILANLNTYERGEYVHVYANTAYIRKENYTLGGVNRELDKSPYAGNDRHLVFRAEIVLPEYMLDAKGRDLEERLSAAEASADRARKDVARQEALSKAAELRAEAQRLEEAAKGLEAVSKGAEA